MDHKAWRGRRHSKLAWPLRRGCSSPLHASAQYFRDRSNLTHQVPVLLGIQRLRPVRKRMLRIVVDLDDQAIGPGGDRGSCHRCDLVADPGAVARIDDDGKM